MSDHVDADFVAEPTALAIREEQPQASITLWQTDDPVDVIARATRVADAIKHVVVSKKLISNIQGKEYPLAEAWTTLAAMLSLDVICEWTRRIEGGWEARVVVRRNGVDVGAAEAQCTRDEKMWKTRDDYALRSMAQTRATSKAIRAKLGFVMTLAGYQATPAEEMQTPAEDDATDHAKGTRAVMALCNERKIDDNTRHTITEELYPGKRSTKDLDVPQLRNLYRHIKERYSA